MYKTFIRPVVLYGSQTWTLSKKRGTTTDDMGKEMYRVLNLRMAAGELDTTQN